MDAGDIAQIISLLVLLALSSFFSSSETALTTVNKIRMRTLSENGDKKAERVLRITNDSGKMLSAILIGNNIVNLSASSIATSLAIRYFGSVGAGIATGILTILILIFGEVTPKTMATLEADRLALKCAGVIEVIMFLLTPAIFVINRLSMGVLLLLHIDPNASSKLMTEEELRTIVDVGQESGVIEHEERNMIHNVFDFGDSEAKEVMIPRIDMTFVQADSTYDELIDIFREDKFTRLPVYEESTDNVIGIINMKDLLLHEGPKEDFHIRNILREAHFTYEYKKISELMLEMKDYSVNFTIVLDEYGSTAGLITFEDLLEEIVGEIRDEYDSAEEELIQQVGPNEYIIEGSMKLDDINDALELSLDSEDYDSIGGLIIELLDHLPQVGESVTTADGIRLVVDSLDKNRIEKVHMYLPQENTEEI